MIETALLNAILATRDVGVLTRHAINDERHFRDHRCQYAFIVRHLADYGELPSVESVIMDAKCTCEKRRCAEFEAVDVVESVDTLALKLIDRNVKLDVRKLLETSAADYGAMDGHTLLRRLREGVEDVATRSNVKTNSGVNWSTSGGVRRAEFEQRQRREVGVKIPILFDEITAATGGVEVGDVISIWASTGVGKTWLGLLQALVANKDGYNVLVESAEMSKTKCTFRLDTIEGGFNNRGLWTGRLDAMAQERYYAYLDGFSAVEARRPDLIVKTPDDWPDGLTLQQLKDDIERTNAKVVVIDQFNLMRFRTSKHEDKASMSRQLKQLAARMGVVIVLLYQTDGDYVKSAKKTSEETPVRELTLPNLGNYSETIAVQQDSAIVLGFDAVTWKDDATGRQRGKALLGVLKGRDGGAGTEVELIWCPDDGRIETKKATDIF